MKNNVYWNDNTETIGLANLLTVTACWQVLSHEYNHGSFLVWSLLLNLITVT